MTKNVIVGQKIPEVLLTLDQDEFDFLYQLFIDYATYSKDEMNVKANVGRKLSGARGIRDVDIGKSIL